MIGRPFRASLLPLILTVTLSACIPVPPGIPPAPTSAFTMYVSPTGNDDNDCMSMAAACRTLYVAVRNSTPGSTIHMAAGEYVETRTAAARHELTILGAGREVTSIRGTGDPVLFMVTAVRPVTIRDVSLSRGRGDPSHYAIDTRSGVHLVLQNCRINDNMVALRLLSGAAAEVRNCLIADNQVGITNSGELDLVDTTLERNITGLFNSGMASVAGSLFQYNGSDDLERGSRTYNIYNAGDLTIRTSSIAHNLGINFMMDSGAVTLERVRVFDNRASGMDVMGGTLNVRASIVRANTGYGILVGGLGPDPAVESVSITSSAILENHTAGLRLDQGSVTIQNSTFSGNVTDVGSGGGIWQTAGVLNLLDSTVAFNTGYGVYVPNYEARVTIQRSVVALNSGDECSTPARVEADTYICAEAWTPVSIGLGPLTREFGTLVHPILPGSPLIDSGGPAGGCPSTDQRGLGRPAGAACDSGAYESGAVLAPIPILTPLVVEPDLPMPVPGVTPEGTPVPASVDLVLVKDSFCRKGPGVAYFDVTGVQAGVTVAALGRNQDEPRWWRVVLPEFEDPCWVSGANVEPNTAAEGLPVHDAPELPPSPGYLEIAERACSPNGYSLTLRWGDVPDENGFVLFRNGEELETLGKDRLRFDDKPPMNEAFLYEVAAYNGNGLSERAVAEEAGCP